MKVLAFGASNNHNSINQKLALISASMIPGAEIETLDLNDFEMPIYSDAREGLLGQPQQARNFVSKLADADALIISFAEHNGTFTAAFKNILDWASRVDRAVFQNKPSLFLSTSPGPGGAQSVLEAATSAGPFLGANIISSLSVPNFFENVDTDLNQIINSQIKKKLKQTVDSLFFMWRRKNSIQRWMPVSVRYESFLLMG